MQLRWYSLYPLYFLLEKSYVRTSRLKFALKFFPKTRKKSKYERENLPNKNLEDEKYDRDRVKFDKIWIKMKKIRALADIYWFLK